MDVLTNDKRYPLCTCIRTDSNNRKDSQAFINFILIYYCMNKNLLLRSLKTIKCFTICHWEGNMIFVEICYFTLIRYFRFVIIFVFEWIISHLSNITTEKIKFKSQLSFKAKSTDRPTKWFLNKYFLITEIFTQIKQPSISNKNWENIFFSL